MHKRTFDKAIEVAQSLWQPNPILRTQVFSFAFYKNRLIHTGVNRPKTHPWNILNPLRFRDSGRIFLNKMLCSEGDLLMQIRRKTNINYKAIDIINIRIDRQREVKMSRPCSSCQTAIEYFKPKSLHYTLDGGGFERYI